MGELVLTYTVIIVLVYNLILRLILVKNFFKKSLSHQQLWLEGRTLGALGDPKRYFIQDRAFFGYLLYLSGLLLIVVMIFIVFKTLF